MSFSGIISALSLSDRVVARLGKTEQLIFDSLVSDLESVKIAQDAVLSGKKIRALFCLLSFETFGGTQTDHDVRAAATIELIHNATLMHDDVIDENKVRRGKANLKSLRGNKMSLLTGDFLLGVAFEIIIGCSNLRAVSVLSKAAKELSEGEIMQLSLERQILSKEQYFEIIKKKTASLFSAAAEMSAVLIGVSEEVIIALRDIGNAVGLAFQIVDDVIDYQPSSKIGKESGVDFKESKFTLPCIIAYSRSSGASKSFWENDFFHEEKDINDALSIMHDTSSFEECLRIADIYIDYAITRINELSNSACLVNFIKFIAKRQM